MGLVDAQAPGQLEELSEGVCYRATATRRLLMLVDAHVAQRRARGRRIPRTWFGYLIYFHLTGTPLAAFESGEGHTPDITVECRQRAVTGGRSHRVLRLPSVEMTGRPSRAAATAAIEAHVSVLDGTPLRAAISRVLEKHEKLGGKERRFTAFAARELSRHQRLLEAFAKASGRQASQLQLQEDEAIIRYALWRHKLTGADAKRVLVEVGLPGPVRPRSVPDLVLSEIMANPGPEVLGATPFDEVAARHSFPTWLAQAIAAVAPAGELEQVLEALNREPALTLRARPPGTRDALIEELRGEGFELAPSAELPDAVLVDEERRAIFEARQMKQGRLQVMDLGSQLLADYCGAAPGMTVLDYCAGAGGKTLALADAVGQHGRVFGHDNAPKRLAEAKRRASELGLRHISFPSPPRLDLADVVLVDAPCSGVGTLAREPDQKWKLSAAKVADYAKTQASLLREVAQDMKPGAVLVYGTCSLLEAENEAVAAGFLAKHPDFTADGPQLRVWPHRHRSGGFFGARFRKAAAEGQKSSAPTSKSMASRRQTK